MQIPFFKQQNDYYCGPAVLQMVLAAHGIKISQRSLAKLASTKATVGTTTANMIWVLEHYDLRVKAKNRTMLTEITTALADENVIIICYTERDTNVGHYAIVRKLGKKFITLLDPAKEDGKVPGFAVEEFIKRWKDPLYTRTMRWAAFVQTENQRKSVH